MPSDLVEHLGKSSIRMVCNVWDKDINKDNDFIGTCEFRIKGSEGKIVKRPIHLSVLAAQRDKDTPDHNVDPSIR